MEATVTDLIKIEADIVDLFTGVKGMNRVYALQPERTHTPCDRNINRRELQFKDCTLITLKYGNAICSVWAEKLNRSY